MGVCQITFLRQENKLWYANRGVHYIRHGQFCSIFYSPRLDIVLRCADVSLSILLAGTHVMCNTPPS